MKNNEIMTSEENNIKSSRESHFSSSLLNVKELINKNNIIQKCSPEKFFYNIVNIVDTDDGVFLNSIEEISELFIDRGEGMREKITDVFDISKIIGRGAFGVVIEVFHKRYNRKAACKIVKKSNITIDEMEIASELSHPNLIHLYKYYYNSKYYFLCLNLMEGGTLTNLIKYRYNSETFFHESEVSVIMRGIIEGIKYMHSCKIIHCDIKPENIMFEKVNDLESLKICDFGLSKIVVDKTSKYGGTLLYMSPEQVFKQKYSFNVDIWACGFILYMICSGGMHPIIQDSGLLNYDSYEDAVRKVKERGWPKIPDFPDLAWNLFIKLCKYEASFRYESYFACIHPWITRQVSSIPETIKEKSDKNKKINEFKNVLNINIDFICFNFSL